MRRSMGLLLCFCLLGLPSVGIAAENAAVIFKAGGGVEPELVADLNEVLVSALLQKGNNAFTFTGKEALSAELEGRRTQSGLPCANSIDCLRAYGKETGMGLFVSGEVARTAKGYRLELTRIALHGGHDRTERKIIEGDLTALIVEVEAAAEWILVPEPSYLVFKISPAGAAVTVNGQPQRVVMDQPMETAPGTHKIEISANGYLTFKQEVTCRQGESCKINAELKKKVVAAGKKEAPKQEAAKEEPPAKPTKMFKYLAWGSGAVAVLAGAFGVYNVVQLSAAETNYTDRAQELCGNSSVCKVSQKTFDSDKELQGYKDDGTAAANMATLSAVGFGLGVAASGAFFILNAMQPDEPKSALDLRIHPISGPHMGGVGFGFDF